VNIFMFQLVENRLAPCFTVYLYGGELQPMLLEGEREGSGLI
jgi:hypothetical protein